MSTFYGEHGRWRTARAAFRCEYWKGARGQCGNTIEAGSRYFDTGETNERGGGFATDRICPWCAADVGAVVDPKGGKA